MLNALSFSNPLLLAALAGLPLLWWLLRAAPPNPRPQRFVPFVLLRLLPHTAQQANRTPLLILLLRMAALACLTIGLAGPVINAVSPVERDEPLIVVIDNSMAAAAAWKTRQDSAVQAIQTASAPGRSIYLIPTISRTPPAAIPQPMSNNEALRAISSLTPLPFFHDHQQTLSYIEQWHTQRDGQRAEVTFFSDGLGDPASERLIGALNKLGTLTIYSDQAARFAYLLPTSDNNSLDQWQLHRVTAQEATTYAVSAVAHDGRLIEQQTVQLPAGERSAQFSLNLPPLLRNDMARLQIDNIRSAGAVHLLDARSRQSLIGLLATPTSKSNSLLDGTHYIKSALSPFARFLTGSLEQLLDADCSVIVLDDISYVRDEDRQALRAFIARGGVVIRFAGPNLAGQERRPQTDPLLPVALRSGGRAFGGALSWETPQALGMFSASGPFAAMPLPDDLFVRRQVIAAPNGKTTQNTWASLADGTPIVTGERIENGALVLFHITATPSWSDLPLSQLFVDMLRRIILLSSLGPEIALSDNAQPLLPVAILNGDGALSPPDSQHIGLTVRDLAGEATPQHFPGLYGSIDAPLALNAVGPKHKIIPLKAAKTTIHPFKDQKQQSLAGWFLTSCILLLLMDALASMYFAGHWRRKAVAICSLCFISAIASLPATDAVAQPLDSALDPKVAAATLSTRLAYITTGDPTIDDLSRRGLEHLTQALRQRTSLEPDAPVEINLDTDDISVYPLLYWPVTADAETLSPFVAAKVEDYMRFGGLIIFDTADSEQALPGLMTARETALQRILGTLNTPALMPLPDDHVLLRSFYLLDALGGRMIGSTVWVQANVETNDAVTPLIIGGADWAGAWAKDDQGRPMRAMSGNAARQREHAMRAGINMVMVAFTGNYKSDQVHMPILLERLGKNEQ